MTDLHTHSTKSDGELKPSELMETAYNCGVRNISLTDHDTVSGNAEAQKKCRELGMNFITGIEISTDEFRDLHILGYGIDIYNPVLLGKCRDFAQSRADRVNGIIELLEKHGVFITKEDVLKHTAGESVIGRPHFAKAMLEKGYVSTIKQAFNQYLATPEFNALKRYKPSFREAIGIIHQAGGLAVMAHPYQLKKSDSELESLISELKKSGLDGIECYYSRHTPEMFRYYRSLADKYNLYISIGSDYHGKTVKPDINPGTGFENSLTELKKIQPFDGDERNILKNFQV